MGKELEGINIHQLDWMEDNKKVKAFFIYESSVWRIEEKTEKMQQSWYFHTAQRMHLDLFCRIERPAQKWHCTV